MSTDVPKTLLQTINGHDGPIRAARFNGDGEYCMTCGSDKFLRLWNPHKGVLLKTYKGHGYEVLDAVASHDNSKLLSCSTDRTVILWDVATAKVIRKYRGHDSKVNCVQFNTVDSAVAISGSYDSTVRCWDTKSKSHDPVQILDDAKDSVSSLHVNDHQILSGSVDGYTRVYDLRCGKLKEDCVGEPVVSVRFTNDQQCLLAASLDSTVRLIDVETGELLNKFTGHKNEECKVDSCVSHTDKHVISGSEDGTIYFWDLVHAKIVHKLQDAHKDLVHSLSQHPTKPMLLSTGLDGVKLWGTDEADLEINEK